MDPTTENFYDDLSHFDRWDVLEECYESLNYPQEGYYEFFCFSIMPKNCTTINDITITGGEPNLSVDSKFNETYQHNTLTEAIEKVKSLIHGPYECRLLFTQQNDEFVELDVYLRDDFWIYWLFRHLYTIGEDNKYSLKLENMDSMNIQNLYATFQVKSVISHSRYCPVKNDYIVVKQETNDRFEIKINSRQPITKTCSYDEIVAEIKLYAPDSHQRSNNEENLQIDGIAGTFTINDINYDFGVHTAYARKNFIEFLSMISLCSKYINSDRYNKTKKSR